MMQMELNNKQGQLNKQVQLKKDLAQIDVKKQNSTADFGSLVISNKGKYFISVALGRIVINNTEYYALSLASPIGQALKGHKQGDSISFNRQNIVIDDVL
jgi:transcription elongation GreA/GreB family factor